MTDRDALHLTPREVAQVEAALDAPERGMRHWVALAARLTREAALRAVVREDEDDECLDPAARVPARARP